MRCKVCKNIHPKAIVECLVCTRFMCMDCYIEHVKGGSPSCTRYCNREARRKK